MKRNTGLPCRIETRIDEKKYLELQQLIQKSSYRNMSELLRDIVYYKSIRIVTYDKSIDMLMDKLSSIRTELHAIGININQITKWFNTEQKPAAKVYHSLRAASIYQTVGKKVDELLTLIEKNGKQWLQK